MSAPARTSASPSPTSTTSPSWPSETILTRWPGAIADTLQDLRPRLGARLRRRRGLRHLRLPRVELRGRVGRGPDAGLRLQRREQLGHLVPRRLELVRERRAQAGRRLALGAPRGLLGGAGPHLGVARALRGLLGLAPLGREPRPLVVERAERLAERAALPGEGGAGPLHDARRQPDPRRHLDGRRAARGAEVELVGGAELLGVEADPGVGVARVGEGEGLQLVEVGGDEHRRAALDERLEHRGAERRALARVGVGGDLVDQHQRARHRARQHVAHGAEVGGEGGEVAGEVAPLVHRRLHLQVEGQARAARPPRPAARRGASARRGRPR